MGLQSEEACEEGSLWKCRPVQGIPRCAGVQSGGGSAGMRCEPDRTGSGRAPRGRISPLSRPVATRLRMTRRPNLWHPRLRAVTIPPPPLVPFRVPTATILFHFKPSRAEARSHKTARRTFYHRYWHTNYVTDPVTHDTSQRQSHYN